MDLANVTPPERSLSQEIVGYLNFSEGPPDAKFYRAVNEAFFRLSNGRELPHVAIARTPEPLPIWRRFADWLGAEAVRLAAEEPAFRSIEQAEGVLASAFDRVIPAYRSFHRDLLFHQPDNDLFRPYFTARILQTVLRFRVAGIDDDELVPHTLAKLNDFLGHRPTAVLQNERKLEPYEHEWVAPLPLYLDGADRRAGLELC